MEGVPQRALDHEALAGVEGPEVVGLEGAGLRTDPVPAPAWAELS